MRHDAIYRAYPNAVSIDDGTGVFDKDGNKILINEELVGKAGVEIDAEVKAKKEAAEAKLEALGLSIDDLKVLGLG